MSWAAACAPVCGRPRRPRASSRCARGRHLRPHETGEAQGLVTRYPAMAAYHPQEQRDLEDWLTGHGAFMRVTWRPSGMVKSA